MHAHTHIHTCMHTYVHMYICTCTHAHTYAHVHMHTIHMYMYARIHTYTHVHVHTYTHVHVHTCTHAHNAHVHVRTHTHTYTHTFVHLHVFWSHILQVVNLLLFKIHKLSSSGYRCGQMATQWLATAQTATRRTSLVPFRRPQQVAHACWRCRPHTTATTQATRGPSVQGGHSTTAPRA